MTTTSVPSPAPLSRRRFLGVLTGSGVVLLAACSPSTISSANETSTAGTGSASAADAGTTGATTGGGGGRALFDSTTVHDLAFSFDQTAYDEMIATFRSTGEKGWIEATVVVDGTTYERVGLRLKGNSSLQGLRGTSGRGGAGGPGGSASADDPSSLPWLVRFDEYVDGQEHEGYDEIVVRSNRTETSLNEAVALEIVGQAGLATQRSFPSRLRVNGSDAALRLVLESPDSRWEDDNFAGDGILYKAESGGDYSYRGDGPADYEEIFDQETGDVDDLTPLLAFLRFLDESDDATFEAELGDHLEVDAFARYLAVQDLVANSDDIDGPGNNSYLRYSADTGRFTIVTWDLNLAFGSMSGGGGPAAGGAPAGGAAAPGGGAARGGGGGGMGGRSNILVQRFNATDSFVAAYDDAVARLTADLYASGAATEILGRRAAVLRAQVTDVVDEATIDSDAATIEGYVS